MGTAAIIENNDIVLHPLANESYIGITEQLQLSSCLICNIGAPNIGIEYSLQRIDDQMVSLNANLVVTDLSTLGVSAGLNYSKPINDDWLTIGIDAQLMAFDGALDSVADSVGAPVSISYLMLNGDRGWNLAASADPYTIVQTGFCHHSVQCQMASCMGGVSTGSRSECLRRRFARKYTE